MSPGGRNTRAKVLLEWSGRFKMEFLQDGVQKQTRQRARTSDNGSGKRFGPDELYAMCMQSVCRACTPSVLYYYDSLLSEKIGKIHFSSVFESPKTPPLVAFASALAAWLDLPLCLDFRKLGARG